MDMLWLDGIISDTVIHILEAYVAFIDFPKQICLMMMANWKHFTRKLMQ